MALPARPLNDSNRSDESMFGESLEPDMHSSALLKPTQRALPPNLPILLNVKDLAAAADLRDVPVPAQPVAPATPARKETPRGGAVLRGIKDLQQLQKQTIAVLEAVKGTLDEIQQVLRSPEATRGMEKQQNAATLLAKGFAREAVEQAQGAVSLLPANPEAHLLFSLSLAADQQFESSLHAARKGLALFDRRSHPLAIEAGLLHALAALGCGAEAVDRWGTIIDSLPLPVLFEHLGRIAACFPAEMSGGGQVVLDEMVNRRLARDNETAVTSAGETVPRQRIGKIQIQPDEIPAPALLAGLDAARDFHLTNSHRAILGQITCRLQLVRDPGDVVRFLTECVVPLGNRELARTTEALGRAAVRRLYRLQSDAMTLHRALAKLQMAGAIVPAREVATLLQHWRQEGNKVRRARGALAASLVLMVGGMGVLAYVIWGMGAISGKTPMITLPGFSIPAVWIGPVLGAVGAALGVYAMMGRTWGLKMPAERKPLTREELSYLNSTPVKREIRNSLTGR